MPTPEDFARLAAAKGHGEPDAPDPANRPVGGEALREAELRGFGFGLQWTGNLHPRLGGGLAEANTINEYRMLIDAVMTDEIRVAMEAPDLATVAPPAMPALEESALARATDLLFSMTEMDMGQARKLARQVCRIFNPPRGPDQSGGVALDAREDGR